MGDREEESKSSHDESVLSLLMSPEVSFPSPTASHVHRTAANCRRDAYAAGGETPGDTQEPSVTGPHACVLAPTGERYTEEHTHIPGHRLQRYAYMHANTHICTGDRGIQTHTCSSTHM